jgi:hypothetical protein
MLILIIIAVLVGLAIYYVTTLDFQIGTGFTEEKSKAREVKYTVVQKENTDKKLLKK